MKTKLTLLILSIIFVTSCNKNRGTVTQTYNKATAQYANIDKVRATPLVEADRPVTNTGKVYFGDKILLVGEKNKGIHVYNNSNTRSPIKSLFLNLPYSNEFYVEGNFIYAETHYDLVKIDISVISAPVLISRKKFAFGNAIKNDKGEVLIGFNYEIVTETIELNSPKESALRKNNNLFFDYNNQLIPETNLPPSFAGTSKGKGTLNRIAVHNSHVYVVGNSNLYTFKDNSFSLNLTSKQNVGNDIETVYAENKNLFIGTESSMIVMNISIPDYPTKTSQYNHAIACDPVCPNGNVAYLTLRTSEFEGCSGAVNALEVIDISNINNPKKINEVTLRSPYGMGIVGNFVFVGEGRNGISILDISTPNNPSEVYHNDNIQTYDVLEHPTIPNVILVIEPNGLTQYQFNPNTIALNELSAIVLP